MRILPRILKREGFITVVSPFRHTFYAKSFCRHGKRWDERDELKDFSDPTNRICRKCIAIIRKELGE